MKRFTLLAIATSLAACATQLKTDATQSTAIELSAPINAAVLYDYRCKGCHEPATPGAPDRKELASLETREIVDALRKGPMKMLATGLTKQEIRALAMFLSDKHNMASTQHE
jgi:polyvinyl alcohol dehydrogenase (cytochrome)